MSTELYHGKMRQTDPDAAKNSPVPGGKFSGANESEFCRYGIAMLGETLEGIANDQETPYSRG